VGIISFYNEYVWKMYAVCLRVPLKRPIPSGQVFHVALSNQYF
jgi:hypothetical protein